PLKIIVLAGDTKEESELIKARKKRILIKSKTYVSAISKSPSKLGKAENIELENEKRFLNKFSSRSGR
ncbi:MAG: hypothetical protein AAFX95_26090, partial [Cyanobacteria bacterium J06639_16]